MRFTEKERPTNIPEGHSAVRCGKCGGSGIFALYMENGEPRSHTGTDCWPCRGTGWIIRRKRRKLKVCPVCNFKQEIDADGKFKPHRGAMEFVDNSWQSFPCKGTESEL